MARRNKKGSNKFSQQQTKETPKAYNPKQSKVTIVFNSSPEYKQYEVRHGGYSISFLEQPIILQ